MTKEKIIDKMKRISIDPNDEYIQIDVKTMKKLLKEYGVEK